MTRRMKKTAMYDICPHCGAYLDLDEKCDCQKEKASPEVIPQVNKPANRWAIDNFKLLDKEV